MNHAGSLLRAMKLAAFLMLAGAFGLANPEVRASSAKPWQVLTGCTLVDNKSNDGDSFHVSWDGTEFIFRISFADCPEDESRFPDRVAAQADYFGITAQQALEVGEQASEFTRHLMAQPFSVKTRWQRALGSSHLHRTYGFVRAGGRDLAEVLVENGLARIHGVGVSGLTQTELERLRALEAKAKADKRGAWGIAPLPAAAHNYGGAFFPRVSVGGGNRALLPPAAFLHASRQMHPFQEAT
jgi:endonuclease YncB( thermonuclease family)